MGKERDCEVNKEFKRRGGRDAEKFRCGSQLKEVGAEVVTTIDGLPVKGIWEGFKAMTCNKQFQVPETTTGRKTQLCAFLSTAVVCPTSDPRLKPFYFQPSAPEPSMEDSNNECVPG